MPEVGVRREFQSPRLRGLRQWPVPRFADYLLFYRVDSDAVRVLRLLHAKMDIARVLEDDIPPPNGQSLADLMAELLKEERE